MNMHETTYPPNSGVIIMCNYACGSSNAIIGIYLVVFRFVVQFLSRETFLLYAWRGWGRVNIGMSEL